MTKRDFGTFNVARSIWTHPAFADEPFTEREAFMWMVGTASYIEGERRAGKFVVHCERGQFPASVRFMADAWQWSKSRVSRFLKRLENRDTLRTESGTGVLVVTICDYEEFQFGDTESGTAAGHSAGQKRDSSGTNNKKDKKDKKKIIPPKPPAEIRDECIQALSQALPFETAVAMFEHREAMTRKDRLTVKAATLMAGKLQKFAADGLDPVEAVNNSIMSGWKGVFPPDRPFPARGNRKDEQFTRILSQARAADRSNTDAGMAGGGGSDVLGPLLAGRPRVTSLRSDDSRLGSGSGGHATNGAGACNDRAAQNERPAASADWRDTGYGEEPHQLCLPRAAVGN